LGGEVLRSFSPSLFFNHCSGWQSSHNLPALLSEIDVLVNPSLRAWSETFCISNIEAMAMKIPLVTFAVGGNTHTPLLLCIDS
jgi:glycosyltransferase involved in cell wall biosynthesis